MSDSDGRLEPKAAFLAGGRPSDTRFSRPMRYHVDGDLVPAEEASVSVGDRGLLYGDGITERLRAYGGAIFAWGAHSERIEERCERLSIPVPDDLDERIERTLAANDLSDARVRLSITRGGGPALTPAIDASPTIVIAVSPAPRDGRHRTNRNENEGDVNRGEGSDSDTATDSSDDGTAAGEESESGNESESETTPGDEPADPNGGDRDPSLGPAVVQTVTIRRSNDPDPLAERAAAVRARLELARAATEQYRADEALLRDEKGYVVGGTASDVLFVDDTALHVPRAEPIGVLRPMVCKLADEESIPTERGRYPPSAVREADEAFLASAVEGLRPIATLDGITVGDGPVRRLLAATLAERIANGLR